MEHLFKHPRDLHVISSCSCFKLLSFSSSFLISYLSFGLMHFCSVLTLPLKMECIGYAFPSWWLGLIKEENQVPWSWCLQLDVCLVHEGFKWFLLVFCPLPNGSQFLYVLFFHETLDWLLYELQLDCWCHGLVFCLSRRSWYIGLLLWSPWHQGMSQEDTIPCGRSMSVWTFCLVRI